MPRELSSGMLSLCDLVCYPLITSQTCQCLPLFVTPEAEGSALWWCAKWSEQFLKEEQQQHPALLFLPLIRCKLDPSTNPLICTAREQLQPGCSPMGRDQLGTGGPQMQFNVFSLTKVQSCCMETVSVKVRWRSRSKIHSENAARSSRWTGEG